MLKWLGRRAFPLCRKVRGNQANQSYWRVKDRARNEPMGGSSKNSRWADVSGVFNHFQACHSLCSPIFPDHFNIHKIQTVTLKMDSAFLQNIIEQIYHTCKPKSSSFTLVYSNDGSGKLFQNVHCCCPNYIVSQLRT
jgi:hypothetical protein